MYRRLLFNWWRQYSASLRMSAHMSGKREHKDRCPRARSHIAFGAAARKRAARRKAKEGKPYWTAKTGQKTRFHYRE